jgi:SAM-dependent methyltransferase
MKGEENSNCRSCPICATPPGKNDLIGYLDATFGGNLAVRRYRLTYCTCNALIYIDPTPSKEDLETMYSKSNQFTDAIYTDPAHVDAINQYMSDCLARILAARSVPLTQALSVLEVGAGRAWMCRAAKQADSSCKTIAQDVSGEVANECEWVDQYLVCGISDPQLDLLRPFDVISLTHVIEHLPDPVAAIQRCKSLLAKDGTIFVTAPHRPEGWQPGKSTISEWQQYSYNHVPAHIQYFSRGSMQKLAEKSGCNLSYWEDRHENGQAFEAWLV